MTLEEYNLLDNHTYSIYTGRMGKIFCDWYDKKIDGTEAIQMLKEWYDKGLKKIKNEKHVAIQKKELKRCFDSLASFIRDNDLIDEGELPKNYKIHRLMKKLDNIVPLVSEIKKVLDRQNQEPKQYIQNELVSKMIEKGILSSDGKTPLKNLDGIAIFLMDNGQFPSMKSLKDLGLMKSNGKPYSDRAYQKALHIANTHH